MGKALLLSARACAEKTKKTSGLLSGVLKAAAHFSTAVSACEGSIALWVSHGTCVRDMFEALDALAAARTQLESEGLPEFNVDISDKRISVSMCVVQRC